MKGLGTIYSTQARLFFRDKAVAIITLILPLMLSIFFGLMFGRIDKIELKIAFIDEDQQVMSQSIIEKIIELGGNDHVCYELLDDKETAIESLEEGDYSLVIVFPEGSSAAAEDLTSQELEVYYDSENVTSGTTAISLKNILLSELNLNLIGGKKVFTSQDFNVATKTNTLAEFYIPNFFCISILWLSIFATALPIVKQREDKILLRMGLTPLSRTTYMIGVTLWRLTIGFMQSIFFLGVCVIILKLNVVAIFPQYMLAVLVANVSFISLGYMIASLSKNMEHAQSLIQIINFSFMFLSGVFFASGLLPKVFDYISYVFPMTYLSDMVRQILVGFKPIFPLWIDFAVLSGCTVLFSFIAVKKWKWE